MLRFSDGNSFAIGASSYNFRPTDQQENNSRIFCPVKIEGIQFEAALDTGGIYVICEPQIACALPFQEDGQERILIRGVWITGSLQRCDLTFLAEEGEDLILEVTIFLPNPDQEEDWPKATPSFLGLRGCLEWIRFAVDPQTSMFYFGRVG